MKVASGGLNGKAMMVVLVFWSSQSDDVVDTVDAIFLPITKVLRTETLLTMLGRLSTLRLPMPLLFSRNRMSRHWMLSTQLKVLQPLIIHEPRKIQLVRHRCSLAFPQCFRTLLDCSRPERFEFRTTFGLDCTWGTPKLTQRGGWSTDSVNVNTSR